MTSKELEEILKSPITKAAKGRFISIEELEQIKTDLEAWEVVKPSISKEHLEDCQIRTMYGENPFMNVSQEEANKVKKSIEAENV